MKLRRIATMSVFGALGLAVATAGLAWACTAQTLMQVTPTVTGPAGSPVQVTASAPAAGPAELRWGGAEGPIMARGMMEPGKMTSLSGTVPATARPGVYYLVLVSGGNDVARAAYEVTGAAAGATSGSAWSSSPDYGTDPALTSSRTPFSSARAGVVLLTVGTIGLAGVGLALGSRRRRAPVGAGQDTQS